MLDRLRERGIASELYPDAAKMKKQMGYANARNIPFVALVGEQEMADGVITLKEMGSGSQERLTPDQLVTPILKAIIMEKVHKVTTEVYRMAENR